MSDLVMRMGEAASQCVVWTGLVFGLAMDSVVGSSPYESVPPNTSRTVQVSRSSPRVVGVQQSVHTLPLEDEPNPVRQTVAAPDSTDVDGQTQAVAYVPTPPDAPEANQEEPSAAPDANVKPTSAKVTQRTSNKTTATPKSSSTKRFVWLREQMDNVTKQPEAASSRSGLFRGFFDRFSSPKTATKSSDAVRRTSTNSARTVAKQPSSRRTASSSSTRPRWRIQWPWAKEKSATQPRQPQTARRETPTRRPEARVQRRTNDPLLEPDRYVEGSWETARTVPSAPVRRETTRAAANRSKTSEAVTKAPARPASRTTVAERASGVKQWFTRVNPFNRQPARAVKTPTPTRVATRTPTRRRNVGKPAGRPPEKSTMPDIPESRVASAARKREPYVPQYPEWLDPETPSKATTKPSMPEPPQPPQYAGPVEPPPATEVKAANAVVESRPSVFLMPIEPIKDSANSSRTQTPVPPGG